MRALLAILRAPSRWLDRRIDARISAGQAWAEPALNVSRALQASRRIPARIKAGEFTHAPQRADAPQGEMVWISKRVASELQGYRIIREVGQRSYLVTDAPSACDALRPSPPQAH